jgi:Na+/H+ antiporter NhaD/arsenite permease-like protein
MRSGSRIGFWEYFRSGAPLTILTIAVEVIFVG